MNQLLKYLPKDLYNIVEEYGALSGDKIILDLQAHAEQANFTMNYDYITPIIIPVYNTYRLWEHGRHYLLQCPYARLCTGDKSNNFKVNTALTPYLENMPGKCIDCLNKPAYWFLITYPTGCPGCSAPTNICLPTYISERHRAKVDRCLTACRGFNQRMLCEFKIHRRKGLDTPVLKLMEIRLQLNESSSREHTVRLIRCS